MGFVKDFHVEVGGATRIYRDAPTGEWNEHNMIDLVEVSLAGVADLDEDADICWCVPIPAGMTDTEAHVYAEALHRARPNWTVLLAPKVTLLRSYR